MLGTSKFHCCICFRNIDLITSLRILKGLKADCLEEMGNKAFWSELKKLGRSISLISSSEAEKLGATSNVSESAAEAVKFLFI